jgi:hypothetical protein
MQMRFAAVTGLDLPVAAVSPTYTPPSTSTSLESTDPLVSSIRVVSNNTRTDEASSIPATDDISASTLLGNMPGTHRDIPTFITPTSNSCDTNTPSPILPPSFSPRLAISRGGTPRASHSHRTPKPSHSSRSHDKPSPEIQPARPRGMTFPRVSSKVTKSNSQKTLDANPHTPESSSTGSFEGSESDRDRDADSVLSFAPSVGGKNLTNWFSGLLGRS